MSAITSEKTKSTPLLSLVHGITHNQQLHRAFMENEEVVFDLFAVPAQSRILFRESSDTSALAQVITEELAQYAQPGKVMPPPDSGMRSAVIGLTYNLINNPVIWSNFKQGVETNGHESAYVNCVFKAFNISDETTKASFVNIFKAGDKASIVDHLCQSIREELSSLV